MHTMPTEIYKFDKSGAKSAVEAPKSADAPYVEPDKTQLGDTHLNPEEFVIREREELLKIESKKRIHGQDELEKSDRSLGPRMFYTEILRRLKDINDSIKVLDGSEGSVALYVEKGREEFKSGDFDNIPPNGVWFVHHKYVGGMLKDWLPEWGHVTTCSSKIAHREVRGWRSVLLQLIKTNVITYWQAVEKFGNPILDQRSKFWFEQTAKYRT